jgi:hypothetical protein
MEVKTSSNIINPNTNTRTNQNNNSGISSDSNSNNNNSTKLISKIQEDFIKKYIENLASFIPTINNQFLDRVEYKDVTLQN